MRLWLAVAVAILTSCSPSSAPRSPSKPSVTSQPWYGQALQQLTTLNRDAEAAFDNRQPDRAASLITQGEAISNRLLAVPDPTRPALEAASDLDDLYGRMLLSNQHYGWARMLFQKNVARWRRADPADASALQRRKRAESQIADCDRKMVP